MPPSSTTLPPRRMTASTVRFMNSVVTGCMKIMTRMADMPASLRFRFARRNLPTSCSSRTKLLTTRTLVTFSCTVEFS